MNMQKALRKLYKAISGEDNYKVNISKLLIDIHYALTGKTPVNKNNHARIISELADNWTGSGGGGGGGGSSDVTEAVITFINNIVEIPLAGIYFNDFLSGEEYITGFYIDSERGVLTEMEDSIRLQGTVTQKVYILNNMAVSATVAHEDGTVTVSGDAVYLGENDGIAGIVITGDCTITIS